MIWQGSLRIAQTDLGGHFLGEPPLERLKTFHFLTTEC